MRVGILETGRPPGELADEHGSYAQMFERLLGTADSTLEFSTYPVLDDEFPASVRECDAWLVTGSRHGVYDGLPWIARLAEFLARSHADGVPIVGICFGHQILAEALGGTVEKSDLGWGLGVHGYHVREPPAWMSGAPGYFAINAIHQDQVVAPPADARVVAGTDFCPYGVLDYDGRAISFQGHPEFDHAFVRDLMELRRGGVFPEEDVTRALKTLRESIDSSRVAEWIANFLRNHQR